MGNSGVHASWRRAIGRSGGIAVFAGIGLASALSALPMAGAAPAPTTVKEVTNAKWGPILQNGAGSTLYRFVSDSTNKSTCFATCAKVWPPLVLAKGQKSPFSRTARGFGTISRPGGIRQVTYQGIPLYTFIGDRGPGQVNGNIKDTFGQWWTVNPARPLAVPTAADSSSSLTPAGQSNPVATPTKPQGGSTSPSSGGVSF